MDRPAAKRVLKGKGRKRAKAFPGRQSGHTCDKSKVCDIISAAIADINKSTRGGSAYRRPFLLVGCGYKFCALSAGMRMIDGGESDRGITRDVGHNAAVAAVVESDKNLAKCRCLSLHMYACHFTHCLLLYDGFIAIDRRSEKDCRV
jgi:hypothetical protein